MIAKLCMCGHVKSTHTPKYWLSLYGKLPYPISYYRKDLCYYLYETNGYTNICECNQFKLDNLKFVEDKAKARGLV